ncbi:MAG: hypothetical protein CML29_08930 [Rhizobiales bacterium]|nr:hypothetical protein [Hyphomicrobiales bacterium]MBG18660.1 hypothetical protein [Hyphomicrobiales bacterium]
MRRSINLNSLRIAAVAAAGLFIAACEPTPPGPGYGGPGYGGPGYGSPGGGHGRICTRIYDPVCATRGRQSQTFPNACEAQSAGWDIRHGGQCRGDGPGYGGPGYGGPGYGGPGGHHGSRPGGHRPGHGPGSRPGRPDVCPQIYQPVCGSDGGRARTYGNECMMRQAGAREVPDRYCRRG